MSNAEKIQIVMNTLELVMVPATFENSDRLRGIYVTLAEVRDDLAKPEKDGEEHV